MAGYKIWERNKNEDYYSMFKAKYVGKYLYVKENKDRKGNNILQLYDRTKLTKTNRKITTRIDLTSNNELQAFVIKERRLQCYTLK